LWINELKEPKAREERTKSDFLLYRNHANEVADFHALRHTFITNLANGGVHPKTAQTLARHSTITLTMDRYSHTLRGAESAALAVLPQIKSRPRDELRATGTDGETATICLPSCLPSQAAFPRSGVQESAGGGTVPGETPEALRR
jgi:hypothetical protein